MSGKYCQKRLDHAKKYATDAFETASKGVNQKTAEATGDLITNKIANKITKDYKNSEQSNSETVTNKKDKEIPKKKDIYLQKKDKKSLMNRDWNNIITEYQKIIIADAVAKSYDVRITKASKNS